LRNIAEILFFLLGAMNHCLNLIAIHEGFELFLGLLEPRKYVWFFFGYFGFIETFFLSAGLIT